MEFEPIETQEDFDRAIKARLERERTKVREQYADYDSLKEKAGRLEEAEKKIGELEDAAAKRNAADELQKVREKVSRETGVSPEIVGMLGGIDEESSAQVQRLAVVDLPGALPLDKTHRWRHLRKAPPPRWAQGGGRDHRGAQDCPHHVRGGARAGRSQSGAAAPAQARLLRYHEERDALREDWEGVSLEEPGKRTDDCMERYSTKMIRHSLGSMTPLAYRQSLALAA